MMGWPNGRGPQPPRPCSTASPPGHPPTFRRSAPATSPPWSSAPGPPRSRWIRSSAPSRRCAPSPPASAPTWPERKSRPAANRSPAPASSSKSPRHASDEALAGLRPIGKLERVDVNAEDVGEEFVDVTARMENARRLEQRLVTLLAARTGKLSDVLAVERELARVREEIERYEGRLRYLRTHAATSTLAVQVHQPYPVVGTAGTSVVGSAFVQAWRNFVAVMALLIQSLGVVVPLAALAVLAWVAVRSYGRMGRTAV